MWTTQIDSMSLPWPSSVTRPSPPAEIEPEPEAPGRRRLGRGGSRLGHFGNMTRRLIRLRQRARS